MARPTKYDPSYCEGVIQHMKQGFSFESYAAVIHVNQDTLYEWAKRHPAFSEARKAAIVQAMLCWERLGIAGMTGEIKNFNAATWIFSMKNRFAWRDRIEQTLDIETNVTSKKLERLLANPEHAEAARKLALELSSNADEGGTI